MASIKGEPFEINSQGYILKGFIIRPQKEGKLPAAIVSHGFSSNTDGTKKYAQIFSEKGYVSLYYDFCMSGSGQSTGPSTGMSVLTEKTDLINVLDYVKTLEYVDKDKIILVGCSQGGFVSALAAVEREKEVQKLIMYYPALCIPDDARRGQMINAKFDPNNVPEQFKCTFITLGKKYALDVMKMDTNKEICGYKRPVLIVHGIEDALVNISYSRSAAKGYPNCNLVEIHGDHGFSSEESFSECKKATIEFLNQ